MAAIIMPEAASIDRTQAVAEKVDAIFAKMPGVETRSMITGYSLLDSGFKTNAGAFFVTLKDFKERYESTEAAKAQNARAVLMNLYREAQDIEEAIVIPVAPPPIPGIGTTGGFEFWIQDTGAGDPAQLDAGDAGIPEEGADAAPSSRACPPRSAPTRSSCAPSSTATRRRCSACRSRTSTARSRRSSAR